MGVSIHPFLHVSQLKKHLGPKAVPSPDLPLVNADGSVKQAPQTVFQVRQIRRNNCVVVHWLVQWHNMISDEATWEYVDFIKETFPSFFRQTVETWANPAQAQTT